MVKALVNKAGAVDFSFMPSLQCDLSCAHCMYDSSPFNTAELDFDKAEAFAATMDWGLINACGFYGGEPGIKLNLYEKFMGLVPTDTPKFTITDGTWSRTRYRTDQFVEWSHRNSLQVFVSSTPYHAPHQDVDVLRRVCDEQDTFTLKEDDTIIPMGRMATEKWSCSFRCDWDKRPKRFALRPGGSIIFQTCDGVYPVVGSYNDSFEILMNKYAGRVGMCVQMRKSEDVL